MSQKRKNKGITIIQLVVIVIIMIVITGVIISRLASDNGIVDNAAKALVKTEEARVREILELALNNATVKYGKDVTVKEYIEELIEEGIIIKQEVLIPGYPLDDEDVYARIQVGPKKLIFDISIDENGAIRIKYIKDPRKNRRSTFNRYII